MKDVFHLHRLIVFLRFDVASRRRNLPMLRLPLLEIGLYRVVSFERR